MSLIMPNEIKRDEWVEAPSGLVMPKSAIKIERKPIAVDLFCGAGGFSLGITEGGFHVVAAADHDPYAAITYMYNLGSYPMKIECLTPEDENRLEGALSKEFGRRADGLFTKAFVTGGGWMQSHPENEGCKVFFFGDVRQLTGQRILDAIGRKVGDVDLVVGGPPCQGFSVAGKREVMDARNSLVFEFVRLVLEIRPRFMVMENVVGLLSMITPEGIPVLDAICHQLEAGNFGAYDALKKSLLASAGLGTGAVSRGRKGNQKDEIAEQDEEEVDIKQLSMFEIGCQNGK